MDTFDDDSASLRPRGDATPDELRARARTCGCPACQRRGPLAPVDGTDYVACGACGTLVSTAPAGDYGPGYYYHEPAIDQRAARRARTQLGHLARMGGERLAGARLLELGCSKGFFVAAARAAGIDAHGLDVSAEAVAKAHERGLAQYCFQAHALAARADLPEPLQAPFDVVVAWEVLEHLDEPSELLRSAAAMLSPGGLFVASTPNAGSAWRRGLGAGWHGFAIPQYHRVYLTRRAFGTLAARCGWSQVRTETVTERAGDLMLLRNGATELVRRAFGDEAARGRAVRAGAALCLAPAAVALDALAGHVPGLEGDTLLVSARRR